MDIFGYFIKVLASQRRYGDEAERMTSTIILRASRTQTEDQSIIRIPRNNSSKSRPFRALMLCVCVVLVGVCLLSGCKQQQEQVFKTDVAINVTGQFVRDVGSDKYAVLTFDLTNLDLKLYSGQTLLKAGDLVYVRLIEIDDFARVLSFSTIKPDRGIFVKGRVAFVYTNSVQLSYDFDTILIPKTTSADPKNIAALQVQITSSGDVTAKSLKYRIEKPI